MEGVIPTGERLQKEAQTVAELLCIPSKSEGNSCFLHAAMPI